MNENRAYGDPELDVDLGHDLSYDDLKTTLLGLRSVQLPQVDQTDPVDRSVLLKAGNAVEVNSAFVASFSDQVNKLSKQYAKDMLYTEAKHLLALEGAASLTQATLRDAFGIDADVETDISPVVSNLFKLQLIFSVLEKTKIPDDHKRLFYRRLVKNVADQSSDQLNDLWQTTKKKEERKKRMRDLEVLVKKKRLEHNSPTTPATNPASLYAVRKSRHDPKTPR